MPILRHLYVTVADETKPERTDRDGHEALFGGVGPSQGPTERTPVQKSVAT